ncbi:MAG: ScyD/ScyE family protein [Caldilineaceae bacterium]|nr:ScyD/ScyE family protein [Caldilineaceae bacterium]
MIKRAFVAAVLVLGLASALVMQPSPVFTQEGGTVIAEGFNGPQGVYVADDGAIYVADSGVGGEEEISSIDPASGQVITGTLGETAQVVKIDPDGTQTVLATLTSIFAGTEATGAARVAELDGELYVTHGFFLADPATGDALVPTTADVLHIGEDGAVESVASLWRLEKRMNPDNTVIESHPYGLAAGPDGKLWVTDAGGNTLLRVDPNSQAVELVATFAAIPGVFPNPNRGGEMLADPVPTGIAFDDDGNALVAFLSGAPFVPGSAKVVKVTPRGQVSDYATNLTMLTDLRRGPDGNFYAVQFAEFTDQGPTPNSGAIVRIGEGEGSTPVLEGLSFPTSIDFNENGDAYVTINGVGAPGSGAVVMYEGVAGGEEGAAAVATAEPTAEPTEEPAAEATAEPTEEATAEATEEPTAEPTEEPTEEPAEEPTATAEPTEEPTEEAAAEATATPAAEEEAAVPSVEVVDQPSDGDSVAVAKVVATQPGWIVIHADADGKPGPVLGRTPVAPGETDNIVVILDEPITDQTPLWAMLHVDEGRQGTYEFPGADIPVQVEGAIAMAPFVADASPVEAATPQPTAEPEQEATAVPEEEAGGEATVVPTEEAAEEAAGEATPEATAEPTEEAVEEPAAEATVEPTAEATEEAVEEAAAATPAAEEEVVAEPGSKGAPATMPNTGAAQTGAGPILLVVGGVLLALAGSVVARRKA